MAFCPLALSDCGKHNFSFNLIMNGFIYCIDFLSSLNQRAAVAVETSLSREMQMYLLRLWAQVHRIYTNRQVFVGHHLVRLHN